MSDAAKPARKSYNQIWIERETRDINRALFSGRPVRIEYHDGDTIGAVAFLRRRAISFHEALLDEPVHRLQSIIVHELAHLATAGEPEHHGPSWRRCMFRLGCHPDTGEIMAGSPLRAWLDRR